MAAALNRNSIWRRSRASAAGSGHGWPAELVGMRTHARHLRVIMWRWHLVSISRSAVNCVRPPDKQGAFCTLDLQASRLVFHFENADIARQTIVTGPRRQTEHGCQLREAVHRATSAAPLRRLIQSRPTRHASCVRAASPRLGAPIEDQTSHLLFPIPACLTSTAKNPG